MNGQRPKKCGSGLESSHVECLRGGKNNLCQSTRSCDFWYGARWSETTLGHSHSIVAGACKHLNEINLLSSAARFTVRNTVEKSRLRAIDGDRCRNEAEPLLQCVPRRATSPVAHEQTFLN